MVSPLSFTSDGEWFVSDSFQGDSGSTFIPHLNFLDLKATLILERTIEPSDGWATVLKTDVQNCIWEYTITGLLPSIYLRVRTSVLPNSAEYVLNS